MNHKSKADRVLRRALFCACEVFAVCTLFMMFKTGDPMKLLMCVGTMAFACLPGVMERLLSCRLYTPMYIFFLLYALGPMLGYCHNLYYLTNWWDKLLHFSGGVVFGVLGTGIAPGLNRGQGTTRLLRAVLGLCFSVAVAGVWELFEYGVDVCFGTDMQGDTVVYAIHSYALGPSPGVLGVIPEVREVTVNGRPLAGYLDIGLADTMRDMLVETVGAVGYFLWFLYDRDRHPLIRKNR